MSQIKFDGKVAVITGAGAGLGKTYALDLAKRGAKVVVNDLGSQRDGSGSANSAANLVVEEILAAGGNAVANYDSVVTIEGGENIVKTALDSFGTIDILINNAGIIQDKNLLKLTEAEWDNVISVHLKGAFCVTKPAFKIMKEKKYGRVVCTASGAGLYGNFGQSNYSAAKMGVIGFMNTLALEGAKYNIKFNAIAPVAASRLTEDILPQEIFNKMKPEFITPLVTYLVSEDNQETGMIFNCVSGWFSRTAIVCAKGVFLGDGEREIIAEKIKDNWGAITSLDGNKVLTKGSVQLFDFLAPFMSS